MGWCSATQIFDAAVDVALEFIPVGQPDTPNVLVKAVVERMYKQVEWDDWDCQTDSKYWDDYLLHIMHDMGEVDDEDYEYYKSFRMNP